MTLSLRIIGVRPDGYHLIDAEMVTLDLADTLEFSAGDGLDVVDGPAAGGAGVPGGADNLVRRALAAVGRTGRGPAATSASRPAAASAADRPTPPPCCAGPAAPISPWPPRLGADVPFCLVGGRARVTGIGEQSSRCPSTPSPGGLHPAHPAASACPRAAVYQAWDDLGGPAGDGANDLEPAALGRRAPAGRVAGPPRRGHRRSSRRWPAAARPGSCAGAYPGPGRVVVRIARPADAVAGLRRAGATTGASLPAGRLQHLLVLLLAHALAALLDQRSHGK